LSGARERFARRASPPYSRRDALLIELQFREITPEDYDLLLELDETIPRRIVARETLAGLPVVAVGRDGRLGSAGAVAGAAAGTATGAGQQECSIRLAPLAASGLSAVLPCGHEFHRGCIHKWLGEHSKASARD
jgi:hypothetical protein